MSWPPCGVGLPSAIRAGFVQHAGRDLPVHGGRAVAEFGGADGQRIATVGAECDRRSENARLAAPCRSWPVPCLHRPASRAAAGRRRRAQRLLDQVEALVEAVTAVDHVRAATRALEIILSPLLTTLRRRNSNGSMPMQARLRPSRILPRSRSAAGHSRERRRPAACWYRPHSPRPFCWGSDRR